MIIKLNRWTFAMFVVLTLISIQLGLDIVLPSETGAGTCIDYIYGYEINDGKISVWLYNDHPSGGILGDWSYSAIYSIDADNTELFEKMKNLYEQRAMVRIDYINVRRAWLKYNSETVITTIEKYNSTRW